MARERLVTAAGAVVWRRRPNAPEGVRRRAVEVLLVHRPRYDDWTLPKGKIEADETLVMTAVREIGEETGYRVVSIERLQGVYSSPARDPRTHAVSVTLVARVEPGTGRVDTLETSEVRSFRQDELPLGEMAHDHERQLRDFLEGRTVIA